jgi:hypothetical protein
MSSRCDNALGNPLSDLAEDDATNISEFLTRADKKAKQKKLLPQDSINQTWRRFSESTFQKALSVLPSNMAVNNKQANWSNDLLCLSYKRTAEDCRQAVQKIVRQCRIFNQRYQDEWDIVSLTT